MAYIAKYYDKKTKTEKVWHNSSMIKYTEMTEDPNENVGDLTVVFNNGSTYKYKDVLFSDYVLLVSGGIDASNGKTFNQVIKAHGYQYNKLETPLTQEYINEGLESYRKMQDRRRTTYFISGPEDFTEDEFDAFVIQRLLSAIDCSGDEHVSFVLADSQKFANAVVDYLIDTMEVDSGNITIYKLSGSDTQVMRDTEVNDSCDSEDEMDETMTYWSQYDISIVRDWETKITRESKNILRRFIYG